MNILFLILYIVAALCFLGAALPVSHPVGPRLLPLGLLAWVLVPLIQLIAALG